MAQNIGVRILDVRGIRYVRLSDVMDVLEDQETVAEDVTENETVRVAAVAALQDARERLKQVAA